MSASGLIQSVFKRRALWDPLNVHHHNRLVISRLWEEVALEIGMNVVVAKSKWRGLRDYYRQQLKKGVEAGVGGGHSGWAHFQEMSFLEGTMSPGRAPSHAPSPPPHSPLGEAFEQKWSPPQPTTPPADPLDDAEEEEDDLLFFRSLLPDFKGLPRATKSFLRLQIQAIVHREVYGGTSFQLPSSTLLQ